MNTEAPTPPLDPRRFHIPAGSQIPGEGAATRRPQPERRRRRRWPWIAGLTVASAVLVFLGFFVVAWTTWGSVDKVDMEGSLGGAGRGTNYLLVGTDSREGVDPDVENSDVIFGEDVAGQRTDTIAVLHLGEGGARLLAIPRDLYVPIDGGAEQRINAAFSSGGPPALVRTVRNVLDIPIDHYLEVDFAGFLGLVKAVGGVTIDFEHPAFDQKSGLSVPEAGSVELDAPAALAYVRSRSYVEVIDGNEVRDGTADLGRVKRQQKFMAAVFDEIGGTINPLTMLRILDGVSGNIRVDDGMSFRHALGLGLDLRGLSPEVATIPTTPTTTSGGAAVLLIRPAEAEAILADYR
jgi:LCP family protein required for cell wall assembly